MIRSFVAIPLPPEAADWCERTQAMLPLARTVPPANLHLTLAFLDSQPVPVLEELHHALEAIRVPAVDLAFSGLSAFGGPRPRSVYATVRTDPTLERLQAKVERAARQAGIDMPARRFVPHVTLARIGRGRVDLPRLELALAALATESTPPFPVNAFALYRSHLARGGAEYEELARYALVGRDLPPTA